MHDFYRTVPNINVYSYIKKKMYKSQMVFKVFLLYSYLYFYQIEPCTFSIHFNISDT